MSYRTIRQQRLLALFRGWAVAVQKAKPTMSLQQFHFRLHWRYQLKSQRLRYAAA